MFISNLREEVAIQNSLDKQLNDVILRLQEDLQEEQKTRQRVVDQLKATFNQEKREMAIELQKEIAFSSQLKDQTGSLSLRVNSLEEDNKKKGKEIQQLNNEIKSLKKKAAEENKKLTRMTEEKRNKDQEVTEMQTKITEAIRKNYQLASQIKELERKVEEDGYKVKQREGEINRLLYKTQDLQSKLDDSLKKVENVETEKRDLTLRLSKLAGANLTYNNPNIADLSDENRPTKLAEEFSELYDNEWTDAFEVIDIIEEKEKIKYMLDILKKANKLCQETTQNHVNAIKEGFATLRVWDLSKEDVTLEENEQTKGVSRQRRSKQRRQSSPDCAHKPAAADTTSDKDAEKLSVKDKVDLKGEGRVSPKAQVTAAFEEHLENQSDTEDLQQKPNKYSSEACAQNTNGKEAVSKDIPLDEPSKRLSDKSATATTNQLEKTNIYGFVPIENEEVKQYDAGKIECNQTDENINDLNIVFSKSTKDQQENNFPVPDEDLLEVDSKKPSDHNKNGNDILTCVKAESLAHPNYSVVNDFQKSNEQPETPDSIAADEKVSQPCESVASVTDKVCERESNAEGFVIQPGTGGEILPESGSKPVKSQSKATSEACEEQSFTTTNNSESNNTMVTKSLSQTLDEKEIGAKYLSKQKVEDLKNRALSEQEKNIMDSENDDKKTDTNETGTESDHAGATGEMIECGKNNTETDTDHSSAEHLGAANSLPEVPKENDMDEPKSCDEGVKTECNTDQTKILADQTGRNSEGSLKKTIDQKRDIASLIKLPVITEDTTHKETKESEHEVCETNHLTGIQTAAYYTVTADFEQLRNEQKKSILEIRAFFEKQLSTQFEEKCVAIIAGSTKENLQSDDCVMKYIRKCLRICWSMCRHEPPVYIEFHEFEGDLPFDTNVFKAYTKSGKLVDFVVWPPLYLYQGGPLLSKGVAQGRKE